MVRQGLARDLTSRDAAPVSENGEHQRVNARPLLQDVQHAVDPFIDERDGSHLNADEPFAGRQDGGTRGLLSGHLAAPLGIAAARAAAVERFRKLRRVWFSIALFLIGIVMTVSLRLGLCGGSPHPRSGY